MKPSELRSVLCCVVLLVTASYIVLQMRNFERIMLQSRLDSFDTSYELYSSVQNTTNSAIAGSTSSPSALEVSRNLTDQPSEVAKYLDALLHVPGFEASDPAS